MEEVLVYSMLPLGYLVLLIAICLGHLLYAGVVAQSDGCAMVLEAFAVLISLQCYDAKPSQ